MAHQDASYGDTQAVGRYLGAPSASTARRWVAELIAAGLPVYMIGKRQRFKFSDVDEILRQAVDLGGKEKHV
jgi:hypothetical protein